MISDLRDRSNAGLVSHCNVRRCRHIDSHVGMRGLSELFLRASISFDGAGFSSWDAFSIN